MRTALLIILALGLSHAQADQLDIHVQITSRVNNVIKVQHGSVAVELRICNDPGKYMTGPLSLHESIADAAIKRAQGSEDNAIVTFDADAKCISRITQIGSLLDILK